MRGISWLAKNRLASQEDFAPWSKYIHTHSTHKSISKMAEGKDNVPLCLIRHKAMKTRGGNDSQLYTEVNHCLYNSDGGE